MPKPAKSRAAWPSGAAISSLCRTSRPTIRHRRDQALADRTPGGDRARADEALLDHGRLFARPGHQVHRVLHGRGAFPDDQFGLCAVFSLGPTGARLHLRVALARSVRRGDRLRCHDLNRTRADSRALRSTGGHAVLAAGATASPGMLASAHRGSLACWPRAGLHCDVSRRCKVLRRQSRCVRSPDASPRHRRACARGGRSRPKPIAASATT